MLFPNERSSAGADFTLPVSCIDALESQKSDTVDLTSMVRRIFVGTGGTVIVWYPDGTHGTYKAQSGSYIGPFECKRIGAGSTATDLVGEI